MVDLRGKSQGTVSTKVKVIIAADRDAVSGDFVHSAVVGLKDEARLLGVIREDHSFSRHVGEVDAIEDEEDSSMILKFSRVIDCERSLEGA
jgi:hypothetical protein